MQFRLIVMVVFMALPGALPALELQFLGNANLTGEKISNPDSYQMPIGPYKRGALPKREVEGQVLQRAWRIEAQGLTTLQLIRHIREQLLTNGFEITFECAGFDCGGFDFRFNTKVMPAPNMYVDLFDFRYLAGDLKDEQAEGLEYISVIVSRAGSAGYVQVVHVTPENLLSSDVEVLPQLDELELQVDKPLIERLQSRGFVVLQDLEFDTDSATLGAGPFSTVEALAAYLLADKSRRVALVGHTDTEGTLNNNIGLSKRRATSVLEHLVADYGVPRVQLEAEGLGYLAPIGPNLTQKGRDANRRVEAVLLNTE